MRWLPLSAELDTTASRTRHGVAREYHGSRDARLRSVWVSRCSQWRRTRATSAVTIRFASKFPIASVCWACSRELRE